MPNQIELILTARDNASPVVDEWTRKMRGAEETSQATGREVRHTTQAFGLLGERISSSVNPALGGVASAMNQASREARGLGVVMAGVTVGAAAAAAGIGLWLEQSEKIALAQAKINLAVRGLDISALRSTAKEIALTLEGFKVESPTNKLREFGLSIAGTIDKLLGLPPAMNEVRRAGEQMGKVNEGIGTVLPIERMRVLNELLAVQYQATQQLIAVEAGRFQQTNNLDAYAEAMDRLTTAFLRQSAAERVALEKKAEVEVADARAREAKDDEIRTIEEVSRARIRAFEAEQNARLAIINETKRQGKQGIAEQIGQQRAKGSQVEDLTVSPDFTGVNYELDRKRREEQAAADAARLTILSQQTDLTTEQRHQYELALIEAEKLVKVEAARGNVQQIALANLEAQIRHQNEVRAYAERTEMLPGLAKGFKDAYEEFSAIGNRMQALAQSIAQGMSTAFGDGFFDILTGNFKDLPDVAKRFTQDMVRSVTQELGKLVTAPILGSIRNLFSSGVGAAVPYGLAGTLGMGGMGGVGAADFAAVGQTQTRQGQYVPTSDLGVAYAQGGDQGVRMLQGGRATVAGGQFIPDYGDLPVGGGPVITRLPSAPTGLARYLAPAAGAASLGLSAYGASQNTSVPGIFVNAGMGGLSGAALGSSIATSFPGLGFSSTEGAVGGALAGAAINATLALMAQQEAAKQAAQQRQAAEVQRASGAGGDLVQAAQGARNLPELFDVIRQFGSGTTGGTTNPAVSVTAQTPSGRRPIGLPNATYPVADVADILRNPGSLQANIQSGASPAALAGPNAAVSTALQARAQELVKQYEAAAEGVGVSEQETLGTGAGALGRRTEVPVPLAGRFQGEDIAIEGAGWAGVDDATKVVMLQELRRVDRDQAINVLTRDPDTDGIVSVTAAAATLLPSTPVSTTPPVVVPTPPGLSTTEVITTGGLAALGITAQLADPGSFLNAILPAGFTGTDLGNLIAQAFGGGSAAGGAVMFSNGTFSTVAPEAVRDAILATGTEVSTVGFQQSGGVGFGDAFTALEGLNAIYGLFQGVQGNDPVGILSSVASLYGSVAGLANNVFDAALPTFGGVIADAVSAVASAAAGGGAAGAAAGAAAANAVGPVLGAIAPFIMAAIAWVGNQEELAARASGWWNNPIRGALYSAATAGVARANAINQGVRQVGLANVSTADLKNAAVQMANSLQGYYATAQGGLGAVRASDSTGGPDTQGTAAYTSNFTTAHDGLMAIATELLRRGQTYEQLGQLQGVSPDWSLQSLDAAGTPADYYMRNPFKYDPEAARLDALGRTGGLMVPDMNWIQSGEGGGWVETSSPKLHTTIPSEATVDWLGSALGSSMLAPDSVTHAGGLYYAMFGGPLWAAIARMGASPELDALIAQKFDPWAVLRTFSANQLAAAARYGLPWTSDPSPGGLGETGDADAGTPGESGDGASL